MSDIEALVFGGGNGIGAAFVHHLAVQQQLAVAVGDINFDGLPIDTDGDITRLYLDHDGWMPDLKPKSLNIVVFSIGIGQANRGAVAAREYAQLQSVNNHLVLALFDMSLPYISDDGRVIVVSSDMVFEQNPPYPDYAATKRNMTLDMIDLAEDNPSVNLKLLFPGPVWTNLFYLNKTSTQVAAIEENVGIYKPDQFVAEAMDTLKRPDAEILYAKRELCRSLPVSEVKQRLLAFD